MSADALITVAMPVRNCASTVARAIGSILSQTEPRFRFVIVDDGSTDATHAVAASFDDPRIRLISDGRGLGLPARLNQIIADARTPYIARMDGDDFAYPDRFARQLTYLEANPGVDLLGASAVAFRTLGDPIGTFRLKADHASICARPELGFAMPHPTWMGRTAWFGANPYPISALRAQDQALLTSAYRTSRFANLPEPLLGYHQDIPTLNSIIGGRTHHARALAREAIAARNWPLLASGLAQHALRTAITVPQLLLGQGEAILARRFDPLTEAQKSRFLAVKRELDQNYPVA